MYYNLSSSWHLCLPVYHISVPRCDGVNGILQLARPRVFIYLFIYFEVTLQSFNTLSNAEGAWWCVLANAARTPGEGSDGGELSILTALFQTSISVVVLDRNEAILSSSLNVQHRENT